MSLNKQAVVAREAGSGIHRAQECIKTSEEG